MPADPRHETSDIALKAIDAMIARQHSKMRAVGKDDMRQHLFQYGADILDNLRREIVEALANG